MSMSDPFSVISSAAGIISLGITVSQGLLTYYSAWNGWEDDVRNAVADIEEIHKFLTLLHPRIVKLTANQADLVNQSHSVTSRIVAAVKKLEAIRDECQAVPSSDGKRHRLQNFSRRSLYPFKQSTLRNLRDAVRQARDGLTSLISLVQIDLKQDAERLQIDVGKLFTEAQNITQKTERVHEHVQSIEQDLNSLTIAVTSTSTAQSTEFAALQERLGRLEKVLETRLEALVTHGGTLSVETAKTSTTPFKFSAKIDHDEGDQVPKAGILIPRSRSLRGSCTCRGRRMRYESSYTIGWLRLLARSESVIDHYRSCPLWNPKPGKKSKELALEHVKSVFGATLKVGVKLTRDAGNLSIGPLLTLRGVVRNDSPVFALFNRVTVNRHKYELREYMDYAAKRMLQLFNDKGSQCHPYDVDEDGRTVLHHIIHMFGFRMSNEQEFVCFRNLLSTCLERVPLNEIDNIYKRTPLETLVMTRTWCDRTFMPRMETIVGDLYEAGGDLGEAAKYRTSWFEIQVASEIGSWAEVTECGPLSQAIIRRDEAGVVRILDENPSAIQERNIKAQSPMHISATWSRGVQILLAYGGQQLVNQADLGGSLPISYALQSCNYESSKLLFSAGSALTSPGWKDFPDEALEIPANLNQIELMSLAVDALRARRMELYKMAQQLLPAKTWEELDLPDDCILDQKASLVQEALQNAGIEVPYPLIVRQKGQSVHHYWNSPGEVRELLFKAGFRDIDLANDEGLTPLQVHCLHLLSLQDGFVSLNSLVSKGVDLSRQVQRPNPLAIVPGVSGYHFIGHFFGRVLYHHIAWDVDSETPFPELRSNVKAILDSIDRPSRSLIKRTVQQCSHDCCICACSRKGCSPVTTMLKSIRSTSFYDGVDPYLASFIRTSITQWLENELMTENTGNLPMLAEDVIRFETFDVLGLTHTCCKSTFTPRCEPEEGWEIRGEECDLIRQLDDLVDDFLRDYEERVETLSAFLTGHWRTRMATVLMDTQLAGNEELRRLRGIGVVIEECRPLSKRLVSGDDGEVPKRDYNSHIEGNSEKGVSRDSGEEGSPRGDTHCKKAALDHYEGLPNDLEPLTQGETDLSGNIHEALNHSAMREHISDEEWCRILYEYAG